MPRFDWRPRFDARSLGYPLRGLVGAAPPARYKYWNAGPVLDQGTEGACVGHGVVGALVAAPHNSALRDPQAAAFGIYRMAQHYDEWTGEAYDGTSVLAGMTIAKMLGEVFEYRWCFGLDDVLVALSTIGPVVLGVNWTEGMTTPDDAGRIHATGPTIGGHCVAATGFSMISRQVRIRQSWGAQHGRAGNVWIGFDDLAGLLANGGEAAVAI